MKWLVETDFTVNSPMPNHASCFMVTEEVLKYANVVP